MFVRIRHWTTEPGAWDRFVGRLEKEGLDAMRATKGFRRMVVTGDPMSNAVVTITFWDSESAERVYEVEKAHDFSVLVKELVADRPETFAYPVVTDSDD
ncbi:MAG: hypothetical protein ACOC3D_05880 [Pseudomonadota bacterium]